MSGQAASGTGATQELARPVNIPPRPALLIALQHEMAREEPHIGKIARLINRDVAIAGNLLAIANSAMFNPARHVETIEGAISLIGLNHCHALLTRLMARRVLAHGRMMMPRFWDVSEKRSWGMLHVARKMHIASPEAAHHFGLFSDIGIPLMMASFPSYTETLLLANRMETCGFVQLENQRHRINHAVVGAMLAEHWNIDTDIVLAIRKHHSFEVLDNDSASSAVRELIAVHLVVEKAIQDFRHAVSGEWNSRGALAMAVLQLSDSDAQTLCEELQALFLSPGFRFPQ